MEGSLSPKAHLGTGVCVWGGPSGDLAYFSWTNDGPVGHHAECNQGCSLAEWLAGNKPQRQQKWRQRKEGARRGVPWSSSARQAVTMGE